MHGAKPLRQFQAIGLRHRVIRQQKMNDRSSGSDLQGLVRAFGFQHLVTDPAEDTHLQLAYRFVVIDDQQGLGFLVQTVSHCLNPFCLRSGFAMVIL
jgi:hypothetical protein